MPIKIPESLPARGVLEKENIFVMGEERAIHQDIRPLNIVLLNLMPTKIVTETQYLRLLSNSPIQIEITLLHMKSHESVNTPGEYLTRFYSTFEQIKAQKYDGLIITGAPVENLEFEDVDYWEELCEIMDWSLENVYATMHGCWGAQAALYHHYGIPKYQLPAKKFGVFNHLLSIRNGNSFLRGFDDSFDAPHSRHTEVKREDILRHPELEILAESEEAGVYLVASKDGRQIFVTGHPEYDPLTLKSEYERDIDRGLKIDVPQNYFSDDDPNNEPVVKWRGHAHLLFMNWLNYYVYQETPYDLGNLAKK